MEITDESILSKISTNTKDQQTYFNELYRRYFKATESYVLKNNGSKDDAKDIFQEVMLVLLVKLNDPDFKLTSSLSTYIYAISKNLWLNKLKESSKLTICEFFEDIEEEMPDEFKTEREQKLTRWINMITKHCQAIIKAIFFLREPILNLAIRQGWKNKHTAQNQKYKCLQQIKKIKEKEVETGQ